MVEGAPGALLQYFLPLPSSMKATWPGLPGVLREYRRATLRRRRGPPRPPAAGADRPPSVKPTEMQYGCRATSGSNRPSELLSLVEDLHVQPRDRRIGFPQPLPTGGTFGPRGRRTGAAWHSHRMAYGLRRPRSARRRERRAIPATIQQRSRRPFLISFPLDSGRSCRSAP